MVICLCLTLIHSPNIKCTWSEHENLTTYSPCHWQPQAGTLSFPQGAVSST